MLNSLRNLKGSRRDRAIVDAIEKFKVLDTEQITLLFFQGIKNSQRVAQRRLKAMFDRKMISRNRLAVNEPFYYYLERPKQIQTEHRLAINWVYVWIVINLGWWEDLFYFEEEQNYTVLRADALAGVTNTVDKSKAYKFCFIEIDRATNPFDKVSKYNTLYQSGQYMSAWWGKVATRFPVIIVVTTGEGREASIKKKIAEENVNGLEFRVYQLDDIKRECRK